MLQWKMSLGRTTVCWVMMTVMFFGLGKAQGDDCQEKQTGVMQCLRDSDIDFSRVDDPFYREEMCREVQAMVSCVEEIREECPNLAIFQGERGRSLDTMLSALRQGCPGQGDECQEKQTELMQCLRNHDIDFSGAGDPSYREEMCREVQTMANCVEECREECPNLAIFQGEQGRSVDSMLSALRQGCPGQGDDCQEKEIEVMQCLTHHAFDFSRADDPSYREEMCREMQKMVSCVEEGREECPNMAIFQGEQGRSVDIMLSAFRQGCPGGTRTQGGLSDGSEESEEELEAECPADNVREFQHEVRECLDHVPRNPQEGQLCGSLQNIVNCIDDFLQRCRYSGWMMDGLYQQMQSALNQIRYHQRNLGCGNE